MSTEPETRSTDQPLGAGRDFRRRFLLHYVPLALTSALALFLFMDLPSHASMHHHANRLAGTTPQRTEDQAGPESHGGDHAGFMHHGGDHSRQTSDGGRDYQQLVMATGYVALGLLGLTLLIEPANLLLGRRVPISNYLCRDVGTWAAIFSAVHVIALIAALRTHDNGSGLVASVLHLFVAPDGTLLTNNFGLGNWTGLAALLIVLGLFAISNDFALRKLKAQGWKRLQRLNYVLFGLVILHAFFYGAFLRMASPFTLLLCLIVIAVFAGQAVGIRLWRRKNGRPARTVA
jgi:methionine sulfoxide reductase heme-binding subunit